jgi:hypothetical protein
MSRVVPLLLGVLLFCPPALAQPVPALHAGYDVYAAGLDVAQVGAAFDIGAARYQVRLAYHTSGLIGFFYRGHQLNTVEGVWNAGQPAPQEFYGTGVWGGEDRLTVIDYQRGQPLIRQLVPPQASEREPVPPQLQNNSVDTLSALALVLHRVADTGGCDVSVHTYDGRRASEINAHTAGWETLLPTGRSIFSGSALRCDFVGQMLAGFKFSDDDAADRRPLHGTAWIAAVTPGGPQVPVRMRFETRWFGEATMFLTQLGPQTPAQLAAH